MNESIERSERVGEVRRIFEECGFGNVALLDSWDGDQFEELAEFLSEEEYQTLLDKLEESGEEWPG